MREKKVDEEDDEESSIRLLSGLEQGRTTTTTTEVENEDEQTKNTMPKKSSEVVVVTETAVADGAGALRIAGSATVFAVSVAIFVNVFGESAVVCWIMEILALIGVIVATVRLKRGNGEEPKNEESSAKKGNNAYLYRLVDASFLFCLFISFSYGNNYDRYRGKTRGSANERVYMPQMPILTPKERTTAVVACAIQDGWMDGDDKGWTLRPYEDNPVTTLRVASTNDPLVYDVSGNFLPLDFLASPGVVSMDTARVRFDSDAGVTSPTTAATLLALAKYDHNVYENLKRLRVQAGDLVLDPDGSQGTTPATLDFLFETLRADLYVRNVRSDASETTPGHDEITSLRFRIWIENPVLLQSQASLTALIYVVCVLCTGPRQPRIILPVIAAMTWMGFVYTLMFTAVLPRLPGFVSTTFLTLIVVSPYLTWSPFVDKIAEPYLGTQTLRNANGLVAVLLALVATGQLCTYIVNPSPMGTTFAFCIVAGIVLRHYRREQFSVVAAIVVMPIVTLVLKVLT